MIYDCFIFYNELDLLELRLHELNGVVDQFVLVESKETIAGNPKPLIFAENKSRFREFLDRIIVVTCEPIPNINPRQREYHQRNAVLNGLTGAGDDDTVLLSDVDEIPDPKRVASLPTRRDELSVFEQHYCLYYVNNCTGIWHGTRAGRVGLFRDRLPQGLRGAAGPILPSGGWHLTFFGGVESIRAYSHQEYNTDEWLDEARIRAALATGRDLFSRANARPSVLPESQWPSTLRADPGRYASWIAPPLVQRPVFHENWYNRGQIRRLTAAYHQTADLDGRVVELGCWEGRSTLALARACYPDVVDAVDTFQGNLAEAPDHPTVMVLRERDVFHDFLKNVMTGSRGNVRPWRITTAEFLSGSDDPIKFCHIDASHDYESVKTEISLCLHRLVPGGVLCGDDFENASLTAPGLNGGVERAVREMLPGFQSHGNFWQWCKPGTPVRTRPRSRPKFGWVRDALESAADACPQLYFPARDCWWRYQARRRLRSQALGQ